MNFILKQTCFFQVVNSIEIWNLLLKTYPDWEKAKLNPNFKISYRRDYDFRREHTGKDTLGFFIKSFKK